MSKSSDAKVVFKGLRLISRTAFSQQACNIQRTWHYSSAKEILDGVIGRVKSTGEDKRKTTVVKKSSMVLARVSMITEGIGQFVRFRYVDAKHVAYLSAAGKPATDLLQGRRVDEEGRATTDVHISTSPIPSPMVTLKDPPAPSTPNPKLSEKSKERKVPSSRIGRLVSYGSLAAGLSFGALAEVTRRTLNTNVASSGGSIFLTDANAERIVNTLCEVRGAALKVGQMLSIQDESLLNPQLMKAFARVRHSADFMPRWQAEKMLEQELGEDWQSKVGSFQPVPFAAASIGQVHLAQMPDGRKVAVKIQYPGVAVGIESDIRNLKTMIKVWKVLPEGLFIDNLMAVASRELAHEVDYTYEAKYAKRFRELLSADPVFDVPEVIDSLSTRQVFTTELVDGLPLDKCGDMDQDVRNHIVTELFRLTFIELFEFRFMQTDPNWSNFLYNPATRRIALLDFGASREYSKEFVDQYGRVMKASVDGDRDAVLIHSRTLGFLTGYETKVMEKAQVDATMLIGEAFRNDETFDFGVQNITRRIRDIVPIMMDHRLTPPPEEIYSLHRKISGIFLLGAKLRAKVNCGRLFKKAYDS